MSKEKLHIVSNILITLICVVIAYLLSQINDSFYLYVEKAISYKWLLILLILSILVLLYSIVYHFLFPKTIEKTVPSSQAQNSEQKTEKLTLKEIHYRLSGLTENEKELLRRFYNEDARTLRLSLRNSTADSLHSLGIIEITSQISTPKGVSYTIIPIYWDYMKKRPDVIGL
ncbi:MAG: superinfection exclusion B family protein [Bacteroidetes bacterium]|nr:superinfection exclusion B family protein [Bacteroidota bacterium]MCH7962915.1 superinfection exclusion B family protein [Bacteroidota bacterium]